MGSAGTPARLGATDASDSCGGANSGTAASRTTTTTSSSSRRVVAAPAAPTGSCGSRIALVFCNVCLVSATVGVISIDDVVVTETASARTSCVSTCCDRSSHGGISTRCIVATCHEHVQQEQLGRPQCGR